MTTPRDIPRRSRASRGMPADRSLILDVAARVLFHPILLVGVFLLFRGHNAPGGGFAGGLVVGAAFALRFLAGGPTEVLRSARVAPLSLVGVGLGLAVLTAVAPLLVGDALLESAIVQVDVPLVGTVKAVSSVVFDVGVFLLVIGVVTTVLTQLGGDLDGPGPEQATP